MLRRAVSAAAGAATSVQMCRFLARERSDEHSFGTAVEQFVMFDALRVAGAGMRYMHDRDCAAFERTQRTLLRDLLRQNAETAYGRAHGFGALATSEDVVGAYRRRMPLATYADVEPYVKRIEAGEENVLNAAGETMLARTSGTSGHVALLPTTKNMSETFFVRGILVVFDVLARRGCLDHLQHSCKLAFRATPRFTENGLRVGPNSSGPQDRSFEKLRRVLYSTPKAGYEILDDEAALFVHALFAAKDANLGLVEANFVTLPARLLGLLRDERIARAIETGTLDDDIRTRIGDGLADELEEALRGPDAERAAQLREAAADAGPGLARRVWPRLKFILSNGTGSFAPHAQRLREGTGRGVPVLSRCSRRRRLDWCWARTERGDSVYCLVPRAMFFEFLPLDGDDTLLADELAPGRLYELVVTTLGGLCRYRLGDVVEFLKYHEGHAPVVRFRYRAGQVLNVRGEKTSEEVLQGAVDVALGNVDFAAYECHDEAAAPGYDVVAAMDWDPDASERLDDALRKASPVFDNWRTKGGIAPTRVIPASPEAFEAYRRHHGGSPQQFKQPRVLRRPGDARALLAGEASTAPPAEAEPGTLRAVAEFARRHGVAAAAAPSRETPPPASAAPETPPRRAWWRRW